MTGEVTIRPMMKEDIQAVSELAGRIWRRHYPGIISTAQIDYMLALMYSPAALKTQMEEGHEFLLARLNRRTAGYISIGEEGREEYFIHKLYVDQALQKRGIGGTLLAAALAGHPRYKAVRIGVNRKNIHAINFYFKYGFTIERLNVRELGQGYVMDDFFMIRRPHGAG